MKNSNNEYVTVMDVNQLIDVLNELKENPPLAIENRTGSDENCEKLFDVFVQGFTAGVTEVIRIVNESKPNEKKEYLS